MKKKLSLITLLALSVQGLFAQGLLSHLNDTTNKRSLFERVTNIEKKNNLFNLKLHMQATFNGAFTDGTFKQAAFKMTNSVWKPAGTSMTGFLIAGVNA